MVGDYISTSFASGSAHPVFASATAPSGAVFAEGMFTSPTGAVSAATQGARAASRPPVVATSSDHPAAKAPVTHR